MKTNWLIILLLITILAMSINDAVNEYRITNNEDWLETLQELSTTTAYLANTTADYMRNMKKVQARMQVWWYELFNAPLELQEDNQQKGKKI